jgi:hypothetical protein
VKPLGSADGHIKALFAVSWRRSDHKAEDHRESIRLGGPKAGWIITIYGADSPQGCVHSKALW